MQLKAIILLLFATCFYKIGSAQDKKTDSLLKVVNTAGEDTNKVNALNALSRKYSSTDAAKAVDYGKKADALSSKINWKTGKIDACNNLGSAYYILFDPANSMHYFKDGLKIAKEANNKKMQAVLMANIGLAYSQQYNNDSALFYYAQAIKLDRENNFKKMEATALGNSGLAYRAMSDFPKALEYLLQALKINKETGDKSQASTLHFIGIVYESMEDHKNALKYELEAAELLDKYGDKYMQAQNYGELGSVYASMGNVDKALEYDKKGYDLSMEVGEKQGAAIMLTNTGEVYLMMNEYNKALSYFTKALKIITEIGDKYSEATTLEYMARTYTAMHDYKDVIKYGKRAVALSKEIKDLEREESAWQSLSESYEKMNQPANALEAYKMSVSLEDSIVNVDKQKEITRKQMQFDFDMKQAKERAAQDKKNAIAKKQLENRRLERNALIGGSVFFVLLSGTLFFGYWRNRRNNILLNAKNITIEARDKEKELLLRELHHRVKNNLQIVSSLLRLQSRQLKDESAIYAIQDSRNRVEAMSLIHQKLYKKDVLTDISIREFIDNLINNISASYGSGPGEMQLVMDIEDIIVHVEIAIPLGLIFNELICNAYKHAFSGVTHPRLELSLKAAGQDILVIVKDNGPGMPEGFDVNTSKSFGMDLVASLVKQLHGTMKIIEDKGTSFEILISGVKMAL